MLEDFTETTDGLELENLRIPMAEKAVLRAAEEWGEMIAFYDQDRGYVAYSVTKATQLQKQLFDAILAWKKEKRRD